MCACACTYVHVHAHVHVHVGVAIGSQPPHHMLVCRVAQGVPALGVRARSHRHPGHAEAHVHHGASERALRDGAVAALVPVVPLAEEVGEARRVLHERVTQLLDRLRPGVRVSIVEG